MKRFFSIIAAMLMCITASAQTEFRHITYKEALAAAKSENKQVFMDFYTDWCGPCKMMTRDVFPQKQVGDFMNKHFVNLKVNAEKGEGVELAKKYKVTAYPTFVIINTDEKEAGRTVGSSTADAFVSKLEAIVDPTKSPEVIKQKYENGDRTAAVVKAYAANELEALRSRRITHKEYVQKSEAVDSLVQDYYSKLSNADRMNEENMFVYRNYTNSPFTPAGRFICANASKFAQPLRAEADSLVSKLYDTELGGLLSGTVKFNAEEFNTLKKEIKAHGLNKNADNSAVYTLIETEAKGDKTAYITACDKLLEQLNTKQRSYLLGNYSEHFKDADDATKKAAAKFLRNHVGEQQFNVMYFTVMQIGELEGRGN